MKNCLRPFLKAHTKKANETLPPYEALSADVGFTSTSALHSI